MIYPPKTVYKFRPWDIDSDKPEHVNSRKIITDQTIYFAGPLEFNDPFDLDLVPNYKLLTPDDWKRKLGILKDEAISANWHTEEQGQIQNKLLGSPPIWMRDYDLEEFGYHMSRAYNRNIGVFCTSARFSNILLWSHYAENHQGICIGFDRELLFRNTGSTYGFVIYSKDLKKPEIKPEVEPSLIDMLQVINYKSPFWSYEKEVRFFRLILGNDSRISQINPACIKEIIFGCKTDMHMKRRTYAFVRSKGCFDHVKFYSAHKKPNYYLIKIKPYDHNRYY